MTVFIIAQIFGIFGMTMNGAAVSSGMGTCGLVGQIGVITGWFNPSQQAVNWAVHKAEKAGIAADQIAQITQESLAINPGFVQWLGLLLVCFILPGVICWGLGKLFRQIGWINDGDLALE